MAKKYGYKPKALSLKGLTMAQLKEIRKSPVMRIFEVAFGRNRGENRAGDNVPWAGVTEGATDTADAIAKIRMVNPGLADRCAKFAAGAKTTKGTVMATYADGVEALMPAAAAERGIDSGTITSMRPAIAGEV